MAVTLGFVVVFFAGVAIAYFAGLRASRPSIPVVPARSPTKPSSATTTTSDPTTSESPVTAIASAASEEAATDPCDIERVTGQPSSDEDETAGSEVFETRRFRRLAFSGTALATIYPPQQESGSEPLRCEVLTRDLSCSGIGIGHTQRLLPQQMIVLDVVGKLLVGEVRWCRRMEKDLYVAGCRLVKTTT